MGVQIGADPDTFTAVSPGTSWEMRESPDGETEAQ